MDESGSMTKFYCRDFATGNVFTELIEPLQVEAVTRALSEKGASLVSLNEFVIQMSTEELNRLGLGPNEVNDLACVEKVYYRVEEFNQLPSTDPTVGRLKELARALQEAGVCNLPVARQTFNNINIQTSDDVLHQFLCISNSESVFGRDNIGMGGRGPWGIHPAHNQAAGTSAFLDGRTVTLKRNGLCYPGNAVVRNSSGTEIKESSRYKNYEVRLANAKCAMVLYQRSGSKGSMRGFRDWGTTSSWGSNRHCSSTSRDRLQFMKHIGLDGCCSQACKDRVQKSI